MPLPTLSSRSMIKEVSAFQLNDRPVFQVKLQDGTSVVIKGEYPANRTAADAQQSIRLAGKMMHLASPGIQAELLTQAEIAVLKSLNPAQLPTPVRMYLNTCLQGLVFYKMPFMTGVHEANDMMDKGKTVKLLGKLKGNFITVAGLGKVVAVDLFIGNHDRFDTSGSVSNTSNVLFTKNLDKTYTPVGLDFYHAESEASNLVAPPPVGSTEAIHGTPSMLRWGGPILMNPRSMSVYTQRCIASLNRMFKREAPMLTPADLLGPPDETAFAAGMAEGVRDLRAYLTKKAGKGKLPQGVLDRMSLLNWAWSDTAAPLRPSGPTPDRPGFTHNGIFFEQR